MMYDECYKIFKQPCKLHMLLIPLLEKQRQAYLCDFNASLVYRGSYIGSHFAFNYPCICLIQSLRVKQGRQDVDPGICPEEGDEVKEESHVFWVRIATGGPQAAVGKMVLSWKQ